MSAIRKAFLVALLSHSVSSIGQELPLNKTSHDLAVSKVTGLMYVRGMSQKCPFDKDASETFEVVAKAVAAGIPNLHKSEIEAASKAADARVERDISSAKEESCKKALAAVRTTADEIEASLKKKSGGF